MDTTEYPWLGWALIADAIIAAVDLALGPSTVMAGLLIVGPLLASARLAPVPTALVGVYALVLGVAVGTIEGGLGSVDHGLRLVMVMVAGGFAVLSSHIRTTREKALGEVARVAQEAILQPITGRLGEVEVATRYQSASPHALVGGDVFDLANTPYGVRIIVADVRGKGLPAVKTAAATVGAFREGVYTQPDLVRLAHSLDRSLTEHLDAEDFVTAIIAGLRPGHLQLVNCGHHPPLRIPGRSADGPPCLLGPDDPATPLGLDPDPVLQVVPLSHGDRVLFYTDGLVEARDTRGVMFGLETPATHEVLTSADLGATLDDLLKLLIAHTGHRVDDDVALVIAQPGP